MKISQLPDFIRKTIQKWLKCPDAATIVDLYKQMHDLAHYDPLTRLPNRLMFQKTSKQALDTAIEEGDSMAIFLLDLDNFKIINDSHGHLIGDEVLKIIADRLQSIIKSHCLLAQAVNRYIECKCIAARLGGDEFVILIEKIDRPNADLIAQLIIQELKEPIFVQNELRVSTSIGISLYPWDGQNMHTLLKSADLAMYAAKEKGKNQHCFHEKLMNTKIERRIQAEEIIRKALEAQHIDIFFQPIINLEDGHITSAEALLRGVNSEGHYVDPMQLIETAEETNLIIPLSDLILKKSLDFALTCRKLGFYFPIAVNVSAQQLTNDMFPELILDVLDIAELPPSSLILEITETTLVENFENSARMLKHLNYQGIKISIDDFGKGYSSFNYLQQLPISKIKIDMSFIQSITTDQKASEIVKAIILMTDALGMISCAEGVETSEQYKKLQEYGCNQIQGYYKYPALSSTDFINVLYKEGVSHPVDLTTN